MKLPRSLDGKVVEPAHSLFRSEASQSLCRGARVLSERLWPRSEGQSLAEVALVLPIVLMVIVGIFICAVVFKQLPNSDASC